MRFPDVLYADPKNRIILEIVPRLCMNERALVITTKAGAAPIEPKQLVENSGRQLRQSGQATENRRREGGRQPSRDLLLMWRNEDRDEHCDRKGDLGPPRPGRHYTAAKQHQRDTRQPATSRLADEVHGERYGDGADQAKRIGVV